MNPRPLKAACIAGVISAFAFMDQAQTVTPRPLIQQAIDEHKLVTLRGNTRREANHENDRGAIPNDLHLDMYLQLKRSPDRDVAAKAFVESLTDKSSPNFHKWITAAGYGQRFGAAPEDIAAVSAWLWSHGFTVNGNAANNMVIDFSGNAGQVREAFHTEIHDLEVSGKHYFANMSDPQIPAALAPGVMGVVSLNNFKPQPMFTPKAQYTVSPREFAVVPGDLATIYNLNPMFQGGYTGQGQTIVVLEDTDLFTANDWRSFRKTFALDQYNAQGTLTQAHPGNGSAGACTDPGINGDAVEAALDVEWASAAAPDAAIVMASCAGTTNFGGFIALQNMLTNGGPLPSVVSVSYGMSETQTGAAQNSYINTLYQTAAAAGVSVFAASGDAAAAASDRGTYAAIFGISVSGFASTPYNVAVGGTDFGDYAAGSTSAFWSATNSATYDSAKSYVPEIPWNDSCGGGVAASYFGFTTAQGNTSFCNAYPYYLDTDGGSGGPSGCATGDQTLVLAVSGSCAGYAKPSWQSIPGNPADGVRDIPDVSLFAAGGFWGHYYVFCFSAEASCSGPPSNWVGGGGTSFSAPIMAGIQAVINQALGENNVGNPNPVYYEIAQNEYSTAAGAAACNSTAGPASTCVFNDVTQGDIVLPCAGGFNCYTAGPGIGLLSTSNTSFQPAYAAGPGWDFATGIGTINAWNLLNAFVGSISSASAPSAPALVSPANAATNVLPTPVLNWQPSMSATSYDVYFGATSPPPLVGNTADIIYSPGTLNPSATYYWAVGAKNSLGAKVSAPWSFTTNCVAALSPSGAAIPASGGTGSIPVMAASDCNWTVQSNASWISIGSGNTGSGNGTVAYTVSADTGAQRTGTISVAGQTFTVTQAGIYPLISTLAGGAMPATAAPGTSLAIPISYGIATDGSGNVYFPGPNVNAVFKADAHGVVTRIAGTGVSGHSGDGGPALSAQLYGPNGVAVDSAGNLYIADAFNRSIRKIDSAGKITTVAGNGNCCAATGDGGPAIAAGIGTPYGIALDSSGNLFISDVSNNLVREVSPSGTISTAAGTGVSGYSGDGGPATSAKLFGPYGVAVDGSGNLYIADRYNYRVRVVSKGSIATFAGNGKCCFGGDGGPASSASLDYPAGVAVDASGNVYIADSSNHRIRKVSAQGTISTVAGSGVAGVSGDGGAATAAKLNSPYGIAADASGNLYIADSLNARIRQVNSNGVIATYAGGAINDGGPSVFGALNVPSGVAIDNSGNTYIADTYNNRIRKVGPDGTISTFAGTGDAGFSGDGGAAASAELYAPQGVAVDGSGNLYIADTGNLRIRMVSNGTITTFAGNGKCCYSGDSGPATDAELSSPTGVAVDSSGNIYIADYGNERVRMVSGGNITTVAGTGSAGFSGDGGAATSAKLYGPSGVAVDSTGNLYIADRINDRIRMVAPSGVITTAAGTGGCCFAGDGSASIKALLCEPSGVAVDGAGNLYIADYCNGRIRKVTNGTITTVAGNGAYGHSGDGGLATGAAFQYPYAVAVDSSGNLAVADQSNNAVRFLPLAYSVPVLSLQSSHAGSFTAGQNGAIYTLIVSNAAQAGAANGTVTVTETLPASMSLVSMAGTGWTCSSSACTRSDGLNPGASYPPIMVAVNVSASASSQATNQANVSGGGGTAALTQDFTIIASGAAALDARSRQ